MHNITDSTCKMYQFGWNSTVVFFNVINFLLKSSENVIFWNTWKYICENIYIFLLYRAYILRSHFKIFYQNFHTVCFHPFFSPQVFWYITLCKFKVKSYFGMKEAVRRLQETRFSILNPCCATNRKEDEEGRMLKVIIKHDIDTLLVKTQHNGNISLFYSPCRFFSWKLHIKICLDFCLYSKNICTKGA